MRKALLLAPLAAVALLTTSCDLIQEPAHQENSEPSSPTPPSDCTVGTVLGHTCMAGTLIQLHHVRSGGQTIEYDADGTGKKTYHHVIATYTDLGALSARGTTLSFTYAPGGTRPAVMCQAYDAPAQMTMYQLSNLSTTLCSLLLPINK